MVPSLQKYLLTSVCLAQKASAMDVPALNLMVNVLDVPALNLVGDMPVAQPTPGACDNKDNIRSPNIRHSRH